MADKDEGAKEETARDEELVQEVSGIAEVPQKLRENWTFVKRLGRFVNNKVMILMKRGRDLILIMFVWLFRNAQRQIKDRALQNQKPSSVIPFVFTQVKSSW